MKDKCFLERAAEAPYALGNILRRLGKPDRARTYYQQAIDTGDLEFIPKAALALARLCQDEGDNAAALVAYEQVLVGSDPEMLAKAIWNYGRLAARANKVDVRTIHQRLLERLPDDLVPMVACYVGEWVAWYGGPTSAAIALLEQAMASGHREAAPRAALYRGWLAQRLRGHRKARAAYQRAIDSGHDEYAPKAAYTLGALLANRGETDEAIASFALARLHPNPKMAARAAYNAGLLFEHLGRPDEARKAFEEAIDAGDRYVTCSAVAHLARLLTQQHETDAAEALLRRWREIDDKEFAEDVAYEVNRLQASTESDPRRGIRFIAGPW
jgi:tetratricopeptide (TPR) repeat protein